MTMSVSVNNDMYYLFKFSYVKNYRSKVIHVTATSEANPQPKPTVFGNHAGDRGEGEGQFRSK